MDMLGLILLVFSFVLAVCAAANWPAIPRPNLGWAAFAFFIAYLLFSHAPAFR
jgi:O-antigen/teichoic acid export membrane protein